MCLKYLLQLNFQITFHQTPLFVSSYFTDKGGLGTRTSSCDRLVSPLASSCNFFSWHPAPAKRVPEALLKNVDLIVLNETETELLTGIKIDAEESWYQAAAKFSLAYLKAVIEASIGVSNWVIKKSAVVIFSLAASIQAAAKLAKMGVKNTIITLGSKGAYYKTTKKMTA